ncbi:MAG: TolC family protein [Acidobacteriia bacterium]|nr:TolC family protein [Terriglobia bacterium]
MVKAASVLAATALLTAAAWAETPETSSAPAAAPTLTLAAALDLAARQNLDIAAARLRRPVAQAGVRVARQVPNPGLSVSAARDTPHESVVIDQPLEIGGRRGRRIEMARQEAALTDLEIAALERRVRREVREAFYGLIAARDATAQRDGALALARRLREIAKARFDAGDVPQLEVFEAEMEMARAEAELAVQQQEEKVALSRLDALLAAPAGAGWRIVGSLEDAPSALTMDELVSRAAQSNSDLERLAQEIRVEESQRTLFRAERIPDLTVEFGSDFNAPGDFHAGARGGFSLEIPLFSRKQGELARSSATLAALDAESDATRRAVAARVEAAYGEWSVRRTEAELYRSSLVPAARRLEGLAEESYREGKANLLTVLDAQRNVRQVEREYRESLVGLQAAFAGLEEAVGVALD